MKKRNVDFSEQDVNFWTVNPKHIDIIFMVALVIIVSLFVFPTGGIS